jgi:hypothetical protein
MINDKNVTNEKTNHKNSDKALIICPKTFPKRKVNFTFELKLLYKNQP